MLSIGYPWLSIGCEVDSRGIAIFLDAYLAISTSWIVYAILLWLRKRAEISLIENNPAIGFPKIGPEPNRSVK